MFVNMFPFVAVVLISISGCSYADGSGRTNEEISGIAKATLRKEMGDFHEAQLTCSVEEYLFSGRCASCSVLCTNPSKSCQFNCPTFFSNHYQTQPALAQRDDKISENYENINKLNASIVTMEEQRERDNRANLDYINALNRKLAKLKLAMTHLQQDDDQNIQTTYIDQRLTLTTIHFHCDSLYFDGVIVVIVFLGIAGFILFRKIRNKSTRAVVSSHRTSQATPLVKCILNGHATMHRAVPESHDSSEETSTLGPTGTFQTTEYNPSRTIHET